MAVLTRAPLEVRVVGAARTPLRDFYHWFLRADWPLAIATIVVGYLALNALFALAYTLLGGVAGARHGSLVDAFYFSVQTLGTIGYGAMYPTSTTANVTVVAESVTSLIVTAVATGLVFSKFARTTARVVFARVAVIAPVNDVPTLMVRLGNERGNRIVDAVIRLVLVRTEHTREGTVFYRLYDLTTTRERAPALSRSWTVLHPIDAKSPLHGQTPADLEACEAELIVTVAGTDDTSLQPAHSQWTYDQKEIVWGARHMDIVRGAESGTIVLDLARFHDVVPTVPTAAFSYPASPPR